MSAPSRQVEVEWQFVVRDVDVFGRWVLRARFDDGAWSVSPAEVLRLRDAYFDTADWRLWRAGYALRVRRAGARVEATLKALGHARGGVARRREITERLGDARLGSLRAARGAVGTRLRRVVGERALCRLFTLQTRRRTFLVRRDGRALAELALDRTRIVTPRGRLHRLQRVEVEVEAGPPALVARFVATLRRARHLKTAGGSKFEAGLAAAGAAPPRRC